MKFSKFIILICIPLSIVMFLDKFHHGAYFDHESLVFTLYMDTLPTSFNHLGYILCFAFPSPG